MQAYIGTCFALLAPPEISSHSQADLQQFARDLGAQKLRAYMLQSVHATNIGH
jgi:hypothetical protein